MEETYTCPNCQAEIPNSDFLPDFLTCPSCNKTWKTDYECDENNYYCWITSEEIIKE
jgi:hypothetical protein